MKTKKKRIDNPHYVNMEILKKVTELKAELDAMRPLDADRRAAIMQKLRLDWNFHSNHLEGNSLNYGETKALILFGITAAGKPLKDHFEMTGHDEAVKWVESMVKEERPLTENFIRSLHKLILKEPYESPALTPDGKPTTKTIKVGEYKTTPNHVKTPTGEIFRFATPEETPAMMNDLIEWYREKEKDDETHPLLLAAEFHYKFIRIHPFDDGNGRTARILMNFILMKYGYPPVIVRTEEKANYIAALQQSDAGAITPFIEYIGTNLKQSLDLMIYRITTGDIDEKNDVDKEIALIEQKVKDFKKKIVKLKSTDSIQDVFDNSVKKLLTEFFNQCKKFDVFYTSASYNYQVNGKGDGNAYSTNIDFREMENSINDLKSDTHNIRITYNYRKFKEHGLPYFNHHSTLEIKFDKNFYSTFSGEGKLLLKKAYHEYFTDEEIIEMTRVETKGHTEFINRQIELAQEESK